MLWDRYDTPTEWRHLLFMVAIRSDFVCFFHWYIHWDTHYRAAWALCRLKSSPWLVLFRGRASNTESVCASLRYRDNIACFDTIQANSKYDDKTVFVLSSWLMWRVCCEPSTTPGHLIYAIASARFGATRRAIRAKREIKRGCYTTIRIPLHPSGTQIQDHYTDSISHEICSR